MSPVLLSVDALTRTRGGRAILDRVSLRVDRGELVGVFGKNGAGKTTLLQMIAGLVGVDAGMITYHDRDVTMLPVDARSRAGLVFVLHEDSVFHNLTVEENLRAIDPACNAAELLGQYGLAGDAGRKASTLGAAARKRLAICRAMIGSPSLLLIDEPFSGIDPVHVGELQSLFRELTLRGTSVIFSDHNVRESLEICDRVYILHEGRVVKEGLPI